ncbi:hypothetical protein JHK85_050846 [Glycine max]|nr:hypothetical protein JHK85_050846 [Glycine max]
MSGYLDIGYPIMQCKQCQAMMWYGERMLKHRHGTNPKFSLCCGNDKVQLPLLQTPPPLLAKLDDFINDGRGPPTICIQGQPCHRIGSLLPMPRKESKFTQLLQFKPMEAHTNLHSRRLFQQFSVDGYTMVESERLYFIRSIQSKLRVDKYCDLRETSNHGATQGSNRGKRAILPSTFVGSRRYMDQLYFDGIIIFMYTIEFQKRGMPYAHLLLFLHPLSKYPTPKDIDKIICAEIPSKNEQNELYSLVQAHMIHGSCGIANQSSPCMKDGNYRCWKPCKKGFTLGRLIWISPTLGELYYLRMMLPVCKGPTCYEDIRTMENIVYPTFRDACFALGFLQDDKEYVEAIKEAKDWGTSHHLRKLFVTMLITSSINKPEQVWKQIWHWLADDILYSLQLNDDELKNLTSLEIEKFLRASGKILKDYPPISCIAAKLSSYIGNCLIHLELHFDLAELDAEFKILFSALTTLRAKKKIVLVVASSGISSLLLPSGRTTHSKFRILLPTLDDSVCNITHGSDLDELLKVTSLIIWDEAPMVHKFCFEALNKTLNDIMKISDDSDTVFRGKIVVFCQIQTLHMQLELQTLQNESFKLEMEIPKELFILNYTDPIDVIVKCKYPNRRQHYKDSEFLQSRAILASTNETVDHINDYVLSLISEREYLSSDLIEKAKTIESERFSTITMEFLNSLSTSGLPNHKIKVKVGSPIMLLRNLDQNEGLCNGTRLIITSFANHIIEAKIMTGKGQGNKVYIPRRSMSPSQSPWPFKLIRRQFPIIVSYAMTINESQGQSLASVGLYLPRLVFSHGQLYVAFSRVQMTNGLKVIIQDKDKMPSSTTTNVVFKEVFQNL